MIHADIKAYNAAFTPASRAIAKLLAKHIDLMLPEATSKVWHAHPVWFIDDNPIVGYSQLKTDLRLMFWSGESFRTRGLAKEGNFKTAGARYTDAKQIDVDLLGEWLAESREVQWDYKNIVKRKGKLLRLK